MTHKTVLLLSATLFLWLLSSCHHSTSFTVTGEVEGAASKSVYLELVDQDKIVMIDSTKASKKGEFKIRTRVPALVPEYYRIRIEDEVVNFAISAAEKIAISGTLTHLSTNYTLEASATNQKIREMVLMGATLKGEIDQISNARATKSLDTQAAADSLERASERYRTQMMQYIIEDPASPAAFFGLFQRFYGSGAFDPFNKADNKIFGAVATSYDMNYPQSPRTKYLVNLTLTGRKSMQEKSLADKLMELPEASSIGAYEIKLPDNRGREVALSSLKGRTVILCFTAYELKVSPALNVLLADIYSRYYGKGVDIYQVSVDSDETFWRNAAENLPWVAVRDKRLLASPYMNLYNVESLPTLFVVNKEGDLVARITELAKLEQTLNTVL